MFLETMKKILVFNDEVTAEGLTGIVEVAYIETYLI